MSGTDRQLRIRTTLAAAALCLAIPTGCAHRGSEPAADGPEVVARVGDTEITRAQLDENLHGHLLKLELEHRKAIYRNQQQVLQYLIDSELVEAEAARRGLTPAELMKAEIQDQAEEDVSEEQMRVIYDQFSDQLEGSYEDQRERIREYLVNGKRDALRTALLERLRSETEIATYLPYPELPAVAVPGGASGPSKGPLDAPVTIVEFSDFQCPFCNRMRPTLDALLEAYPGKLRLVYRHFPLSSHDMAQAAAEASLCADEQGEFWAYHDQVFEQQQQLSDETLGEIAAEVGLDVGAYEACVADRRYRDKVRADYDAGIAAGVQGSPAFFVNGRPLFGVESERVFRQVIERELARLER